jgi:hypothetical protein
MMLQKLFNISAFAAITAAGLSVCMPTASSQSLAQARYLPGQSVSYEFGSKFMSGYFVEHRSECFVTLMVIEKIDPDDLLPVTAARVRLTLYPGQVAGLDSEEGRSLNFTCGERAGWLGVDIGERDTLVAMQHQSGLTELVQFRRPDSE